MSPRRLLFGLALLVAGALLGVLAAEVWHAGDERPASAAQAGGERERPAPAPATAEPIRIGNPDPEPAPELPEATTLNRVFTGVAARVTPAVVFISVQTDAPAELPADGFHDDLPYYPRNRTSAGSGVIVSPEGYIVTNAHVVQDAARIRVLLADKREFDAELVGADATTDLAVIRLLEVNVGADEDEDPLPVATLGDSDAVEVGEWVLAVGSPFRLTGTVTQGIVSALGRQVDIIEDSFRIEDFIQTDAAINPGNSGGALANLRGEVVGIATAIATESGSYEGYGFAVPINLARRVATDLIAYGEVERGYLGVVIRPVTAADAQELGMRRIEGVLIESVARGTSADRAGLRERDVILTVEGEPVDSPNQFQSRIALYHPGDDVAFEIWRGGERFRLSATLIGRDDPVFAQWLNDLGDQRQPAEPPPPEPPADAPLFEAEDWGIRFRDLTPAERRAFGVSGGALVEAVVSGSAADVDGLPAGAVVTRIEERPVGSAEQARAAMAALAEVGAPALLRVRRQNGLTAFYDLQSPYVD
ncbi:MAG TPA: trypsin-like peptidase domain-containing protein [Rubricoccaceae bacterium]|nr:trypsin-like peptidase domain-containing protein [Rubricoccaceae bacterium]